MKKILILSIIALNSFILAEENKKENQEEKVTIEYSLEEQKNDPFLNLELKKYHTNDYFLNELIEKYYLEYKEEIKKARIHFKETRADIYPKFEDNIKEMAAQLDIQLNEWKENCTEQTSSKQNRSCNKFKKKNNKLKNKIEESKIEYKNTQAKIDNDEKNRLTMIKHKVFLQRVKHLHNQLKSLEKKNK